MDERGAERLGATRSDLNPVTPAVLGIGTWVAVSKRGHVHRGVKLTQGTWDDGEETARHEQGQLGLPRLSGLNEGS